jgi:hypothetical protein
LVDAVTVAVTPAASVPLVDDKVTHEATFDAVQFIEAVPVFLSVYIWLTGVYVLPTVHDEVRPPAGVTVSGPATVGADTVMGMVVVALCSPWTEPESLVFPNQAAA